eukprot:4194265-Amphidinium_carterae.1
MVLDILSLALLSYDLIVTPLIIAWQFKWEGVACIIHLMPIQLHPTLDRLGLAISRAQQLEKATNRGA